jgi:hypothetical protein
MKTYVLFRYHAELFLEWENFQTEVSQKIKTHILHSINIFRKSWPLWNNVEKYGRAKQDTNDNIIWCMRFARRITKARIQT